jgi:nucleotide-binding universal stress UspA family protein
MHTYRAILVPLDGSPLSENALPLAIGIARRSQARICLAKVCNSTQPRDMPADRRVQQERQRELTALERLAKQASSASGVTTEVALLDDWADPDEQDTTVMPASRIASRLLGYASATDIDLIVVTTHGRGGISRLWLGSVADQLIHNAAMPIVLMRPDASAPRPALERAFERILIPLDGSPLAEHAIAHALALGTPGETVYTLVQILSPLLAEHVVPPYTVGLPATAYAQLESEARAYLRSIAQYLRPHARAVSTQLVVADPAEAILQMAVALRAELIAMTTHGRGVLARTVLGSVASRVVRGAEIPVLIYRPEGAAQWQRPEEMVAAQPVEV